MSNESMQVEYNDQELQRLFAELDIKNRQKALKGAFRKEANYVRKLAINNLRDRLRSNRDLEKGIRAIVFKKKAGFRVTVGTKRTAKKDYGFHTNRRGKTKPVLIWAELGTDWRSTRVGIGRKAKKTGRMRRFKFLGDAKEKAEPTVTNDIHEELRSQVIKIAKKHGCI